MGRAVASCTNKVPKSSCGGEIIDSSPQGQWGDSLRKQPDGDGAGGSSGVQA